MTRYLWCGTIIELSCEKTQRGDDLSTVEILLIGVGLSMDAFAVAICKGLGMRRINYKHTFIIALFFGGFQALMPFLGWLLGSRFAQYITRFDHWIAFILLLFIGGKMVWDTLHENEEEEEELPARSVEVTSSLWGMLSIPIGTEITMKAELINFKDDDICTFQWQYRPEGADAFIDIGDANELTYVYYIDEENFYYTWRLIVIVAQGE